MIANFVLQQKIHICLIFVSWILKRKSILKGRCKKAKERKAIFKKYDLFKRNLSQFNLITLQYTTN